MLSRQRCTPAFYKNREFILCRRERGAEVKLRREHPRLGTKPAALTSMASNWYKDFMAGAGVEVGRYTPSKSEPGPPMDLANMRENGVRSIAVYCLDCNRRADVEGEPQSHGVELAVRAGGTGERSTDPKVVQILQDAFKKGMEEPSRRRDNRQDRPRAVLSQHRGLPRLRRCELSPEQRQLMEELRFKPE